MYKNDTMLGKIFNELTLQTKKILNWVIYRKARTYSHITPLLFKK